MKLFAIIPYYLYWHYTKGFKNLNYNFVSLLIFEYHFFSLKVLFSTLFQPFQRIHESYSKNILDVEGFFSSLVINTLMRLIGFVVRAFIITMGLCAMFSTLVLFPFIFLAWTVFPFLLVFLLVLSIWSFVTYN